MFAIKTRNIPWYSELLIDAPLEQATVKLLVDYTGKNCWGKRASLFGLFVPEEEKECFKH